MSLGATTYTAVSWTTGDVITEAKLDNMVANDQAYDSHAAQGILLNNNVGYYQKDSGGTNRAIANLDASNVLNIGDGANMETGIKTMAKARVYLSGDQSINSANDTVISFNTEDYDVGSDFNTGTYTFTAPITGYYLISATAMFLSTAVGKYCQISIYSGATRIGNAAGTSGATTDIQPYATIVAYLTATSAITFKAYHENVGAINISGSSDYETNASIHLLSI